MAAGAPGLTEKADDVPYVYVLKCADDSLYCGWTTDLSRRLAAHQAGTASRYTRSRLPVEVAKVCDFGIAKLIDCRSSEPTGPHVATSVSS